MNPTLKSRLKTFLKLSFVVGLLYFLVQHGFISIHETGRAFSNWKHSVPGLIAMLFTGFLGAVRWQLLLRAQDIELSMGRTTKLTFIGNFFNVALPGAVSGDFVKAFYVGKAVQGKRTRAFGSILFDRVAGMSALVFVSAAALLLGFHEFEHSPLMAYTRVFLFSAAVCVFVFYTYLFLVREHHDPVLKLLRTLEARIPKSGLLARIYEALRHYHNHRAVVLQVLALSIFIHLLVGWAALQFAAALGDDNLSLLAVYVIVPLGLLVTAIPVAPAGVGTGHTAFLILFRLLGSQRGADIFTLIAMVNILLGAIGGVVYLRFRTHEPKPL